MKWVRERKEKNLRVEGMCERQRDRECGVWEMKKKTKTREKTETRD